MWNSLKNHVYRALLLVVSQTDKHNNFRCPVCGYSELFIHKDLFVHIHTHCRSNETVTCVFRLPFFSLKSRKHRVHTLNYFKPEVVASFLLLQSSEAGMSTYTYEINSRVK